MNKLIILTTLLFCFNLSFSQTYCYIDSIAVIPANPTTRDSVRLQIFGNLSSSTSFLESIEVATSNTDILLNVNCGTFSGIGLTVLFPFDTIIPLGKLFAGTYIVNLSGIGISNEPMINSPYQFSVLDAIEESIQIDCPSNIVLNDIGQCGVYVEWVLPTVSGGENITIESSHESGSFFPIGTTTATYTATDDRKDTATCSFDITIIDKGEYTRLINCPEDIVVTEGTTVSWIPPVGLGVCDSEGFIFGSHEPEQSFPLGTTKVEYALMNGDGIQATCSFNVRVERERLNCNLPTALIEGYEKDVSEMALQLGYEIGENAVTTNIAIPEYLKDEIWDALAAVYNARSIPERDTIFDITCIHNTHPAQQFIYQRFSVELDTTFDWTQKWLETDSTGIGKLDSLFSAHGFIPDAYTNFQDKIVLVTEQFINSDIFIEELEKYEGIMSVSRGGLIGGGSQIRYVPAGSSSFLEFSLGWGDCPSGCLNRRSWRFRVLSDCSVQFLGAETIRLDWPELSLPEVNCNLSTTIKESNIYQNTIDIFPNPVFNFINVKTLSHDTMNYHIINTLGIVKAMGELKQNKRINIQYLEKGVYFFIFYDKNNNVLTTKKIIKL